MEQVCLTCWTLGRECYPSVHHYQLKTNGHSAQLQSSSYTWTPVTFFCFLTLVNFKMSRYIPFSVPPGDSPCLIVVLSINNNLYMSCRMEDNKVVLFLEVNINSHDTIPFYFFLEVLNRQILLASRLTLSYNFYLKIIMGI